MYLVIPFPTPGKTQRFLQKLLFFFLTKKKISALHVHHTLWYHFIDVQCPRIRKKRDPGHHLHKGARNFERKSNGSPHSVSQSFFFTHFSIFTTFGQTLKRLFYHKVILKSINFLIDDRKHRDRGRVIPFPFAFTSSLVQQLIQNGHMNMLVT